MSLAVEGEYKYFKSVCKICIRVLDFLKRLKVIGLYDL